MIPSIEELIKALRYLEMPIKQLISLEANSAMFSKRALKSLNNQTDFDSAIRRFDPPAPARSPGCCVRMDDLPQRASYRNALPLSAGQARQQGVGFVS